MILADFIGSSASRYVIAAAAFLATGCAVFTVAFVFAKREARLERRLAGYEGHQTQTPIGKETSDSMHLVQPASEVAGRIAGAGVLEKVEQLLDQAKLPMRPAEFLVYVPIRRDRLGDLRVPALWAGGCRHHAGRLAASPFLILKRRSSTRLKQFQSQLPDALNLLAGSMRAGFSFMQGLEAVADEASEPIRGELQRVFTEARVSAARSRRRSTMRRAAWRVATSRGP